MNRHVSCRNVEKLGLRENAKTLRLDGMICLIFATRLKPVVENRWFLLC